MKLLIVVQHRFQHWTPPDWFVRSLRRDFPALEIVQFAEYAQAEPLLRDTEVLITWSLRAAQFALARNLRWIHSPAAAVHSLLIPEIIASDVVVTNCSAVHGPVVAEHAMALILCLARRIPSAVKYQEQRVWAQDRLAREVPRPREIAEATLGLIGVGAIGREVARLALAFGMRLLVVRERPERGADFLAMPNLSAENADTGGAAPISVCGFDALEKVLAQADFVVLAAPVTPKTRVMINTERLQQMKPDAYLINVSRGALVDEQALTAALRDQRIAGAALDVFDREPLPPESPLWDLPTLLITPHSAAFTDKMWERHYALFTANLRRYLDRRPLVGTVDKAKGY